MSNWVNTAALEWLKPLYEALQKGLLKREVLCADETTLQVLREPGKDATSKSYMWLYLTGNDGLEKPIILYEYQPSRSAQHPKLFLNSYKGHLHVDGYEAYHKFPKDIIICGYLAHARRKYDEALKSIPKADQLGSQATIGKDAYLTWLEKVNPLPQSTLGKAVGYSKNQWEYLQNYMLDGRCEISNNRAERSIKPFVL